MKVYDCVHKIFAKRFFGRYIVTIKWSCVYAKWSYCKMKPLQSHWKVTLFFLSLALLHLYLMRIQTIYLLVCYYHVTYEVQSESTLYSLPECQGTPCPKQASYLKFKWLPRNWIRTHNHLVREETLNHLAKWAKWFSCFVSIYLYGAFNCMLLSCHIRVSGWIYTLWFAWMSRNSLLRVGTLFEV